MEPCGSILGNPVGFARVRGCDRGITKAAKGQAL